MDLEVAAAWVVDGFASAVGLLLRTAFPLLLLFFVFGSRPKK